MYFLKSGLILRKFVHVLYMYIYGCVCGLFQCCYLGLILHIPLGFDTRNYHRSDVCYKLLPAVIGLVYYLLPNTSSSLDRTPQSVYFVTRVGCLH